MRVFLHTSKSEFDIIELEDTTSAEDVLREHVKIEEAELWLEDADQPFERTVTLIEVVEEDAHLHGSRCKKIEATINFHDRQETHSFPPSATIDHVFKYSVGDNGFNLPRDERPKHQLVLCQTTTVPDKSEHIGSLAKDCEICFDLNPKKKFEG